MRFMYEVSSVQPRPNRDRAEDQAKNKNPICCAVNIGRILEVRDDAWRRLQRWCIQWYSIEVHTSADVEEQGRLNDKICLGLTMLHCKEGEIRKVPFW